MLNAWGGQLSSRCCRGTPSAAARRCATGRPPSRIVLTIDLMEHLLAVVDHEDFVRGLGNQAALEALVAPAVLRAQYYRDYEIGALRLVEDTPDG